MSLRGIGVLDLTWLLPGPFATQQLADLGADVVKIERPGVGDYLRNLNPDQYQMSNRNKRSLSLNLRSERGREVFYRLAREAEVVVESFQPGVVASLGVDYPTLRSVNPRIVYCSISGYGQTSPYKDWPGHDLSYLGVGGGLAIPADIAYPPVRPSVPVADCTAGLFGALSILAACWEARETGEGQYIDLAMADAVAAVAAPRLGNVLWKRAAPVNRLSAVNKAYQAGDGKGLTLSVVEDKFFEAFCRTIGKEEWLEDPRFKTNPLRIQHARELLPEVERIMRTRTRDEWIALFDANGVPSGPVYGPEEVYDNPHAEAQGLVQEMPDENGQRTRFFRYPARFSREDTSIRSLPPSLGQHTEEVLQEAGYTETEIEELRAAGTV